MSALSRRHFLALTGSAAAATLSGSATPAGAAMGPADKFDLVIKGGDVLDPSQSLRGKRSSANAALEASRQNAAARVRIVMEVSRSGSSAL